MKPTQGAQHGSMEQWNDYARDALPHPERDALERHLEHCGSCLAMYMEAIERLDDSAIPVGLADSLSDRVIAAIDESNRFVHSRRDSPDAEPAASSPTQITEDVIDRPDVRRTEGRPGRLTRVARAAAPYVIAAAITALLIGSGAVGAMAGHFAELDEAALLPPGTQADGGTNTGQPGASWSQHMMDRTVSWLGELQSKRFR